MNKSFKHFADFVACFNMNQGSVHGAGDKETLPAGDCGDLILFDFVNFTTVFVKSDQVRHVVWGEGENH